MKVGAYPQTRGHRFIKFSPLCYSEGGAYVSELALKLQKSQSGSTKESTSVTGELHTDTIPEKDYKILEAEIASLRVQLAAANRQIANMESILTQKECNDFISLVKVNN